MELDPDAVARALEDRRIYTPWGEPDTITEIAPGITLFTTPSHGGIHLDDKRMACLPVSFITNTGSFSAQRASGWFEEDVDMAIPMACYPNAFEEHNNHSAVGHERIVELAHGMLRNYRDMELLVAAHIEARAQGHGSTPNDLKTAVDKLLTDLSWLAKCEDVYARTED